MKKITIFTFATIALISASCTKEAINSIEKEYEHPTFVASYEADTKTELQGTSILWNKGDAIKIFTPSQSAKYVNAATEMLPTATATFNYSSGDNILGSEAEYAFYPYSDDATYSSTGSTITFNLPATQKRAFINGTFEQGENPAVGTVSNGKISFKNVCGYLKLSVKVTGSVLVKKVVLTTKGEEKLYGTFTVDASAENPSATYLEKGGNSITLDCGSGVLVSSTVASNFIFVVPVGAFSSGFDVVFYNEHDREIKTLSTTKANTIARKTVKTMPEQTIIWLPSGYTELNYLRSVRSQGSYINSGFNADHNSGFEIKFNPDGGDAWQQIFSARYEDHVRQFGLNWNAATSGYSYAQTGRFEHAADNSSVAEEKRQNNCELTFGSVNTVKYINHQFTSAKGKVSTVNPGTYTAYGPVYIFALNQGGSVGEYGTADLYYLKFYQGSTLARYFIPAKDGSEALGLYDVVGNKFYTNAGSGSFTAGEY